MILLTSETGFFRYFRAKKTNVSIPKHNKKQIMVKITDSFPGPIPKKAGWLRRQRWHAVRLLQLAFGAFCLGDFLFYSHEWTVFALGGILLVQGVFDWQMCWGGRCRV